MYRIGITSIGSGVGQSIIDSCNQSKAPLFTVGYGNNQFAFGAFDCNKKRITPSIYDKNYINKLLSFCKKDKIDLLIPSLDDELILLAKNKKKFKDIGTKVIISSEKVLHYCRDKKAMSQELNNFGMHFVKSYTSKEVKIALKNKHINFPLIAKPKSGFASRGIFILKENKDLEKLNKNLVIQEIAAPHKKDINYISFCNALAKGEILQNSEISLQVLIDKKGKELGRFASYNKLQNGVPIEVIPAELAEAWKAVDDFLPYLIKKGAYGPLNIQGRLTDTGPKFFEMNARFTGITGLRSMLGFNEVIACIYEALEIKKPISKLIVSKKRIGLRQVKNKIVSIDENIDLTNTINNLKKSPPSINIKNILITGANGKLGKELISQLLERKNNKIFAVSRETHKKASKKIVYLDYNDLNSDLLKSKEIDIICHLASARPFSTNKEIAESIKLTRKIIELASNLKVNKLIYSSSQAVYGTKTPPPWTEKTETLPETPYAYSKLAGENFFKLFKKTNKNSLVTILRFSQLTGISDNKNPIDTTNKIIEKTIENNKIIIEDGQQRLDILNYTDAANAIVKTINKNKNWPETLNIGSGNPIKIIDLAKKCLNQAKSFNKKNSSKISVNESIKKESFGMNIKKSYDSIRWKPKVSIDESIKNILANKKA